MDDFGWFLFIIGVLLLVGFGVIGMETGNLRVANLSGMIAGMSCVVSGAVFVIGGRIEKRLPKQNKTQIAEESVEAEPVEISAPKTEEGSKLSPIAAIIVLVVIFALFSIPIFI